MRSHSFGWAAIFTVMLLVSGCQWFSVNHRRIPPPDVTGETSSVNWAVRIEKTGVPNLHRISDELYGGGQPTVEGFRQLKTMGVKTVINLRFFHNDKEKIAVTDLAYEEIPMNVWHAEDEDVVRFLKLLADKKRTPFYFYCNLGADRTGLMCAVYRIAVQGWTKDEAITEMTQGGFGFHAVFPNLVHYLRKLDVEKMKRQVSWPLSGNRQEKPR